MIFEDAWVKKGTGKKNNFSNETNMEQHVSELGKGYLASSRISLLYVD